MTDTATTSTALPPVLPPTTPERSSAYEVWSMRGGHALRIAAAASIDKARSILMRNGPDSAVIWHGRLVSRHPNASPVALRRLHAAVVPQIAGPAAPMASEEALDSAEEAVGEMPGGTDPVSVLTDVTDAEFERDARRCERAATAIVPCARCGRLPAQGHARECVGETATCVTKECGETARRYDDDIAPLCPKHRNWLFAFQRRLRLRNRHEFAHATVTAYLAQHGTLAGLESSLEAAKDAVLHLTTVTASAPSVATAVPGELGAELPRQAAVLDAASDAEMPTASAPISTALAAPLGAVIVASLDPSPRKAKGLFEVTLGDILRAQHISDLVGGHERLRELAEAARRIANPPGSTD